MNESTLLLFYLSGAAALGCVIGWCISSIVAGRAENRLTREFRHEKRVLNDHLEEAQDESARLNGLLNKAKVNIRNHENQAFMSKQTVNADVQHQLDLGRTQILELESDLEVQKQTVVRLQKEASERESRHVDSPVAKPDESDPYPDDSLPSTVEGVPVLVKKRGPEVLPGNYDGFNVLAADTGLWQDIDTEKYDFLSASSHAIEVDDDILALSETGVFEVYRQGVSGRSVHPDAAHESTKVDKTQFAMQNKADSVLAISDGDLQRPAATVTHSDAQARPDGLFSRFNKRNK